MVPHRIFISAVSRELKSYRTLVEQSLQKRGYLPVFQELFTLGDQRELITAASSSKPLTEAGISEPEEALMELADVSLAHIEDGSCELHRLVQEITRGRIAAEQREPRLRSMLTIVDEYPLGDPLDVRSWPVWDSLSVHVAAVVQHADAVTIATPTRLLMNQLGLFLAERARFAEAEPLMRRVVSVFEKAPGADHPDVATALNNLASLLWSTNRLGEAEPLMRHHLEIFIEFGERTGFEHPHIRAAIQNYRRLLAAMGRSEAEIEAALNNLLKS